MFDSFATPWSVVWLGSCVHRISQAPILEWVVISFSIRSSQPRDWTHVFCIGRQILYLWATREAQHRILSHWLIKMTYLLFSNYFLGFLLLQELHMDLCDIVEGILNAHDTTKVSPAGTGFFLKMSHTLNWYIQLECIFKSLPHCLNQVFIWTSGYSPSKLSLKIAQSIFPILVYVLSKQAQPIPSLNNSTEVLYT